MNARRATLPTAIVLILLAVYGVSLRTTSRRVARALPGDTFWRLTYSISFQATKPKAMLEVAYPFDTARCRVADRQVESADLSIQSRRRKDDRSRQFELIAPQAGPHQAKIQFDIHLSPRAVWRWEEPSTQLTAEARAECLRSQKGIEVDDPIVRATLERLQTGPASNDELVERIFDYCLTELNKGGRSAPSEAAAALKQGVASTLGRMRVMVALCRAGKIPARPVTGFVLKQDADVRPHVWLEVLTNSHWEPYDPDNGFARDLPHNFLPVRRDGVSIVRSRSAREVASKFSLLRIPPPPGAVSVRRPVDILDLTRLPVETHEVFALLLLMPLGALVTAVFRTIVGVNTFGTFTPTLLALSFVYADWRTGLLVFVTVLVMGLGSRTLLDRLKLLLVPRLSVILTLVALTMVFEVSLLDYLSLTPSAQAVLLPMVILTMTIERFYLTAEEDSPRYAAQLMGTTMLVAACCYMVLRWDAVGRLLLVYPELHLVTIAALILLGRYSGYRLSELWRFRDLAEQGDAS